MVDVADETIREVMKTLGRRGGVARAANMSAKERRAGAIKASRAASAARTKRAKQKRAAK
jgi:hypothetical protein